MVSKEKTISVFVVVVVVVVVVVAVIVLVAISVLITKSNCLQETYLKPVTQKVLPR